MDDVKANRYSTLLNWFKSNINRYNAGKILKIVDHGSRFCLVERYLPFTFLLCVPRMIEIADLPSPSDFQTSYVLIKIDALRARQKSMSTTETRFNMGK